MVYLVTPSTPEAAVLDAEILEFLIEIGKTYCITYVYNG